MCIYMHIFLSLRKGIRNISLDERKEKRKERVFVLRIEKRGKERKPKSHILMMIFQEEFRDLRYL